MTRPYALRLLDDLEVANTAHQDEVCLVNQKHAVVLAPLNRALSRLEKRARDLVELCGREIPEARASYSVLCARNQLGVDGLKGYQKLGDVEITLDGVSVGTMDYLGDDEWKDGKPIVLPLHWFEPDSTVAQCLADLRFRIATKAEQRAAVRAEIGAEASARATAQRRAQFLALKAEFEPCTLGTVPDDAS